ncbi:hypothetical protein LTS16_021379 [Friedmanniomyces endolithicus]|nr:hypothetical protein LTR35_016088 [Friedmanniomyces endolithicus]KAK0274860.1 hypothetical protein LTS00_015257 [Friedmanniomyces endolithicus]KAK0969782.1 hypothetical protein LTS01_016100 [Friedmanniomyces endolithicus]KAK0980704.1 hypothetical protein LTR54_015268 [Friedmanniomyces endolithicus]KAK1027555.1 hypothetical protein LTS16_021379 [Friedmanniomyces endolithicus]
MSQQQQQQQQMNMAGGPVGGGGGGPPSQQQAQMAAGTPSSGDGNGNAKKRLNTVIYDYLLRNNLHEVARGFLKHMDIEIDVKKSPNSRGQPNGVADDGMDLGIAELKDLPDDLPMPAQLGDGPFLLDWWCQFWEIYTGYLGKGGKSQVLSYIANQRQAQKARTNMMAAGGMDAAGMQQMRMTNGAGMQGMNNGGMGMPTDLQRKAVQNRQNMTPQQQAVMQMQRQQHMQGNVMERQGSQMEMNGPHSNSPGSVDAPSPKRQRLDGNMQHMGQRPGQPNQMPLNPVGHPASSHPGTPNMGMAVPDAAYTEHLLRQKGIDPSTITPQHLQFIAMQSADRQTKSVETYSASLTQTMKAALNKSGQGMPQNPAANMGVSQGSPMSMDVSGEFYAASGANGARGPSLPPGMPGQAANLAAAANGQNGSNGNHALQDYQMQLMLLEQQNKKRLLMARQEQDSMTNPGMAPTGSGSFQQAMSPGAQGRGSDPSPNAGDMQRGTPKMNKGVSPNGDMGGRGSPQPHMMGGGMGPDQLRQHMLANGGQMMRPPSSHPIGPGGVPMSHEQMMLMRSQGGMMPNGNWQQGQGPQMMAGQPGQGPPGPHMTPRQQPMGPPPAPANGTGPSSPAQAPAPPTPSQTTKAKPGAKKNEGKKGKKGAQNTNATPAAESEAPPTPTPATPITAMHQAPFNPNQNKAMTNGQPPPPQGQPPQPPPAQSQPVQPPPSMMDQPFGSLDSEGFGMNMDFGNIEGGDVLDNFDFDFFVNTNEGDPGLGIDANFAFGDGLEAGADLQGGN